MSNGKLLARSAGNYGTIVTVDKTRLHKKPPCL
jgi:hypothetical protein